MQKRFNESVAITSLVSLHIEMGDIDKDGTSTTIGSADNKLLHQLVMRQWKLTLMESMEGFQE